MTLAAWAIAHSPRPSDWQPVREALAGVLVAPREQLSRLLPPSPALPERPPRAELEALWCACLPLDAVPSDLESSWTGEVRVYLAQRGFDVGWLTTPAARGLARILPPPERFPYPAWWPYPPEVYRLALLAFEPDGAAASIQARAIRADLPAQDKTRNPRGFSYAGALFADDCGREFLRAGRARESMAELEAVVVAEGLTDTLKLAQVASRHGRRWAVLGMVAGSANAFRSLSAWPRSVPCWVATDGDEAGDRYALQVREALPAGVMVERVDFASRQEGAQ
ncbi:toprim domain-containing protein [Archangium sp.]|uniref:toprim domain-containing protein n=1 Tax=Archangium sp. TaxID=1872627 RepID=UPI00286C6C36|nr:toprim domain-containing protein [Archangium sp.]